MVPPYARHFSAFTTTDGGVFVIEKVYADDYFVRFLGIPTGSEDLIKKNRECIARRERRFL